MLSRVIFLLFLALSVVAVPLGKRQIGNVQCNVNRLQIVKDLAQAKSTVKSLTTQLADDPDGSQSIATVADGISSAQSAIGKIALSLVTGQQASADDRQAVADGLESATTALGNITSTDPDTTQLLSKASDQLDAAGTAGAGVVANCK